MKTLKLTLLAAALLAAPLVMSAQPINCGVFSGDTLTQIQAAITQSSPCSLDSFTLYGPWAFVSSVIPNTQGHPNITTDDITVQFIDEYTSPVHTVGVVFGCASCAVNGAEASQFFTGFWANGTFVNFGVLLASHAYARVPIALTHEYSMPTAILNAQLGAAGDPGWAVTAVTDYLQYAPAPYYAGTFSNGEIPVSIDLQQIGFGSTSLVSYEATVYLSQPLP